MKDNNNEFMVPQIKIVVTGSQAKDSGGIMMSHKKEMTKAATPTPTDVSPTVSPKRHPIVLPKRVSSPSKEGGIV